MPNTFEVILATNNLDELAVEGKIPWTSPEDMQYFRNMTSYSPFPTIKNILICGRTTWETMKKLKLSKRVMYVVSSKSEELQKTNPGVFFFPSFQSAVATALSQRGVFKVWVIGGRSIYLQAFYHPQCGDVYWNHIQQIDNKMKASDTSLLLTRTNFVRHTTNRITTTDMGIYRPIVIANIGVMRGVEIDYLRLMSKIIHYGEHRQTRNAATLSLFNERLQWDMADGFPLLTTKRMFWKGIVEELMFFIRGDTQSKHLEEAGVKIWVGNTNKDFLHKMGFDDYEEGEMGPMYGYQWRFFNKPYRESGAVGSAVGSAVGTTRTEGSAVGTTRTEGSGGVDQLTELIAGIKADPNSRRHLLTTYNPSQVREGVLYPCHSLMIQCYVDKDGRLSMNMYQRSADVFLGLPFNIASTSLLCMIIAQLCDLRAGRVSITVGDAHIYTAHVDACNTQLQRECYPLPTLKKLEWKSLEEVEKSGLKDYVVQDYKYHPSIRAPMFA